MARKLDLDAAVLKNTIQRFNANANAGHDPDFHRGEHTYDRIFGDHKIKSNPSLMPLEKPPFYALRIYPGDIGTNGGLVTDVNGAVRSDEHTYELQSLMRLSYTVFCFKQHKSATR